MDVGGDGDWGGGVGGRNCGLGVLIVGGGGWKMRFEVGVRLECR